MEIERRMTAEGHKVASLTGAFEGSQRDVIIDAFRTGLAKVLITTNVLARGIDVQSVSMVVNYVRLGPVMFIYLLLRIYRMCRTMVVVTLILKRTCIALAVRGVSGGWESLSASFTTRRAGACSMIYSSISV